jgi:glutathione peroxidase-family protein
MPIKAYFTKFLIDRNGLVENRFSPIADYKELENNIKKLLKLDIN